MATPERIAQCFIELQSCGFKPPGVDMKQALGAFGRHLRDLTDEQIVTAVACHIDSGSAFWPTPGQLRAYLPGEDEQPWEDAYDIALAAQDRYRSLESTRFGDDPIVDKAIRQGIKAVGGWQAWLNHRLGDAAPRAAFRAAYQEFMTKEKASLRYDSAHLRLTGATAPQLTTDVESEPAGLSADEQRKIAADRAFQKRRRARKAAEREQREALRAVQVQGSQRMPESVE